MDTNQYIGRLMIAPISVCVCAAISDGARCRWSELRGAVRHPTAVPHSTHLQHALRASHGPRMVRMSCSVRKKIERAHINLLCDCLPYCYGT